MRIWALLEAVSVQPYADHVEDWFKVENGYIPESK
jgi:hypothetical protein